MITVLSEGGRAEVEGRAAGDDLWLSSADLEKATGWTLKPEGFCRAEVCVPVPPASQTDFIDGDVVNAATLWRHMGQTVVHSSDGGHWYLGEGAGLRGEQLESLEAPDFTLPDLAGNLHSLSEHRGKKVFLATWASW